jgi:hypothetical protein
MRDAPGRPVLDVAGIGYGRCWACVLGNVAGEPAWRDGAAMAAEANTMEKIVALCKRRGFIFQSSEIYGGIGGFWDYGPLGTELKRNIKDAWWQDMVRNPPPGPGGQDIQMVGVDCSIIMNPKVWEASGHVGGFQDPMLACKGMQRQVQSRYSLAGCGLASRCTPSEIVKGKIRKIKRLKKRRTSGRFECENIRFSVAMGENVRDFVMSAYMVSLRVWFSVETSKPITKESYSQRDSTRSVC